MHVKDKYRVLENFLKLLLPEENLANLKKFSDIFEYQYELLVTELALTKSGFSAIEANSISILKNIFSKEIFLEDEDGEKIDYVNDVDLLLKYAFIFAYTLEYSRDTIEEENTYNKYKIFRPDHVVDFGIAASSSRNITPKKQIEGNTGIFTVLSFFNKDRKILIKELKELFVLNLKDREDMNTFMHSKCIFFNMNLLYMFSSRRYSRYNRENLVNFGAKTSSMFEHLITNNFLTLEDLVVINIAQVLCVNNTVDALKRYNFHNFYSSSPYTKDTYLYNSNYASYDIKERYDISDNRKAIAFAPVALASDEKVDIENDTFFIANDLKWEEFARNEDLRILNKQYYAKRNTVLNPMHPVIFHLTPPNGNPTNYFNFLNYVIANTGLYLDTIYSSEALMDKYKVKGNTTLQNLVHLWVRYTCRRMLDVVTKPTSYIDVNQMYALYFNNYSFRSLNHTAAMDGVFELRTAGVFNPDHFIKNNVIANGRHYRDINALTHIVNITSKHPAFFYFRKNNTMVATNYEFSSPATNDEGLPVSSMLSLPILTMYGKDSKADVDYTMTIKEDRYKDRFFKAYRDMLNVDSSLCKTINKLIYEGDRILNESATIHKIYEDIRLDFTEEEKVSLPTNIEREVPFPVMLPLCIFPETRSGADDNFLLSTEWYDESSKFPTQNTLSISEKYRNIVIEKYMPEYSFLHPVANRSLMDLYPEYTPFEFLKLLAYLLDLETEENKYINNSAAVHHTSIPDIHSTEVEKGAVSPSLNNNNLRYLNTFDYNRTHHISVISVLLYVTTSGILTFLYELTKQEVLPKKYRNLHTLFTIRGDIRSIMPIQYKGGGIEFGGSTRVDSDNQAISYIFINYLLVLSSFLKTILPEIYNTNEFLEFKKSFSKTYNSERINSMLMATNLAFLHKRAAIYSEEIVKGNIEYVIASYDGPFNMATTASVMGIDKLEILSNQNSLAYLAVSDRDISEIQPLKYFTLLGVSPGMLDVGEVKPNMIRKYNVAYTINSSDIAKGLVFNSKVVKDLPSSKDSSLNVKEFLDILESKITIGTVVNGNRGILNPENMERDFNHHSILQGDIFNSLKFKDVQDIYNTNGLTIKDVYRELHDYYAMKITLTRVFSTKDFRSNILNLAKEFFTDMDDEALRNYMSDYYSHPNQIKALGKYLTYLNSKDNNVSSVVKEMSYYLNHVNWNNKYIKQPSVISDSLANPKNRDKFKSKEDFIDEIMNTLISLKESKLVVLNEFERQLEKLGESYFEQYSITLENATNIIPLYDDY